MTGQWGSVSFGQTFTDPIVTAGPLSYADTQPAGVWVRNVTPTSFEVEQTVQTKQGAKTCTLDTRKNQIVLITTEKAPTAQSVPATANEPAASTRGGVPSLLDILVVGR